MCAVCSTDLNESKTSDEALLSAGLHRVVVTGAVGDGGSDAVALQNAAKIIPSTSPRWPDEDVLMWPAASQDWSGSRRRENFH